VTDAEYLNVLAPVKVMVPEVDSLVYPLEGAGAVKLHVDAASAAALVAPTINKLISIAKSALNRLLMRIPISSLDRKRSTFT